MSERIQSDVGRLLGDHVVQVTNPPAVSSMPVTIPYRANLLGNIEQALKGLQGYGIMALELIQNADDAGARSLSFDALDDALVVSNDGEFSSCGFREPECPWLKEGDPAGLKRPCNFHAIAEMGSRSKLQASEQIGRFGIGFVSVYQITDTPIVRSVGVEVQLNPQTQEVVKSEIEILPGTQFVLPWAFTNSEVRAGLNASPAPIDVADKVVAEIDRTLQGSLLFLRHVETVEVRRNGRVVVSVNIDRTAEQVILRFSPAGTTQKWLLLSRSAKDIVEDAKLFERFEALGRLDRSLMVNVAVPLNIEVIEGLLYAYLPTRQSTGMPIHLNADFFPIASRQAIILDGEQHEKYWNEALLVTAASALAENFIRLRDLLGPSRFWTLAEAAFRRKTEPAFKHFWDRLSKAAIDTPSIWTTRGVWSVPKETVLPPEAMAPIDQAAVADLGIALIHPKLRPHWTVLSSIGARQLRLSDIVSVLEALNEDATSGGGEPLRRLWSAIELMIGVAPDRVGLLTVLPRLKAIPFILDIDDHPISPTDARRLPDGVSPKSLRGVLPSRRVVHPDVRSLRRISDLVPEYLLDDLAQDLAGSITDEASASAVIGSADSETTRFYELLTSFPIDRGTANAANTLSDVPMLRTGKGFVSPTRGQLPGDFRDPIGRFQIVNIRLFPTGMMEVARGVLKVDVLTFREYVIEHLEDIITSGITREQYIALLSEIITHRSQLDEDGTFQALSELAFVRNRGGDYSVPADCYFWSAPLASVLGDDPARWVDETWISTGLLARTRDLFEARLGMPVTVAAEHIVQRIEDIAENSALDDIVAGTTPIIRHVLDHWSRFGDADRITLGRLREVAFLSAIVNGERQEERYPPTLLYRAGRAPAFASQVAVVEMPALRQSNAVVNDFLDLIEMPAEPQTTQIVAHLEHCMSTGTPVHDQTYQMLNERLERANEAASIDRLLHTDFIFVADVGFIGAGEVFWLPPPFGGHWHSANQRMRQREQLYRRLGVVDSPEPRHFAALAVQIAGDSSRCDLDIAIQARCLTALAEAFEREDQGASEAVDLLADEFAFLNLIGEATWTGEAVWLDSEQLAASFGSALDDRLVRLKDVGRSAAVRFLTRLKVPALTDIARFRLAEPTDGRPAVEATELIRDRADLILWLAPNRPTRIELGNILTRLEIRCSERLLVQAEIDVFDPPVRSPSTSADAYLDVEGQLLNLRSSNDRVDWAAAFRAIFSEVERYCPTDDIRPLCSTAAYIMSLPEWADAEQAIRTSGFNAPTEDNDIEIGRELGDEAEDQADQTEEQLETADDVFLGGVENDESGDGGPETEDEYVPDEGASGDTVDTSRSSMAGRSEKESSGATDQAASEGDEAISDDDCEPENASDEDVPNETYGSAAARGAFGAGPSESKSGSGTGERASGAPEGYPTGAGSRSSGVNRGSGDAATERQARRSRMLSYVSRSGERAEDDAGTASVACDVSDQIDAAAMKAALSYEQGRGWAPERQPHFNPGFDIVSKSPDGRRRLIEVKGLENEWNERGIKLSHVQFSMAREHPDEFWIYVVEHARDLERQRVTAISNPFGKVEEYWFDDNWRNVSEEGAMAREIHLKVGLKVEHHAWGKGTVVEIKSRGVIPFVVIDFGPIEGRRGLPFRSSLKILD